VLRISNSELIFVNSPAIRAVGCDGHTLSVQFHTGRIYDHPGGPASVQIGVLRISNSELIFVNSPAIRAVGCDGHTLSVQFHTGRIYDHPGGPASVQI